MLDKRVILIVAVDAALCAAIWPLSYLLAFPSGIPASIAITDDNFLEQMRLLLPWVILSQVALLAVFGTYREKIRHRKGFPTTTIIPAALFFFGLWALINSALEGRETFLDLPVRMDANGDLAVLSIPWLVLAITTILNGLVLGGIRMLPALFGAARVAPSEEAAMPVLVVGAGDVAKRYLVDPQSTRTSFPVPRCLATFDVAKVGRRVEGIPVVGTVEKLPEVLRDHEVGLVVIALDHYSPHDLRQVVEACRFHQVVFELAVQKTQLDGETVLEVRPLRIEDLLGVEDRTYPLPDEENYLYGETVLITGAGGNLGGELLRQIAPYNPKRVIAVGRGENSLSATAVAARKALGDIPITVEIGDIRDEWRIREIFLRHRPTVVFHAASHKRVELFEHAPSEAIRNNVVGTAVVAFLAKEFAVRRFIHLSSGAALRPETVLGATKAFSEKIVLAFAAQSPDVFSVVRLGELVVARGSVLDRIEREIAFGGPVLLSHPDATQTFATLAESAALVLQAGRFPSHDRVLAADRGAAFRLSDVARNMIALAGKTPERDILIQYTGLRPGERLRDESLIADGTPLPQFAKLIAIPPGTPMRMQELMGAIKEIAEASLSAAPEKLRGLLKVHVDEYHPASPFELPPVPTIPRRNPLEDVAEAQGTPPHLREAEAPQEAATETPFERLDPEPLEQAIEADASPIDDLFDKTEPPLHATEVEIPKLNDIIEPPEPEAPVEEVGLLAEEELPEPPPKDPESLEDLLSRFDALPEQDPQAMLDADDQGPQSPEDSLDSLFQREEPVALPINGKVDDAIDEDLKDDESVAPPMPEPNPALEPEAPEFVAADLIEPIPEKDPKAPIHDVPTPLYEEDLRPEIHWKDPEPPAEDSILGEPEETTLADPARAGESVPPEMAQAEEAEPSDDLFAAMDEAEKQAPQLFSPEALPLDEPTPIPTSSEVPVPVSFIPKSSARVVVVRVLKGADQYELNLLLSTILERSLSEGDLLVALGEAEDLREIKAQDGLLVVAKGSKPEGAVVAEAVAQRPDAGSLIMTSSDVLFADGAIDSLTAPIEAGEVLVYSDYTEDKDGSRHTVVLHDHEGCPHERFEFGPVIVYNLAAIAAVGGIRSDLNVAWEYDLHLKLMEKKPFFHHSNQVYTRFIPFVVDSKGSKVFSPGMGPLGGFSYVFYPEEVEREVTTVFEEALRRRHAWIDHPTVPVSHKQDSYEVMASIVIPILNRVKYIGNAIEKVQKGTYQNFEMIIVDNGSTDGTIEKVKSIAAGDPRIRLLHGTGGSIASALNEGIKAARGKYICQLDSDDEYSPDCLEQMIGHLESHPNCGLAISYYRLMDENGVIIEDVAPITHSGYSRNQILRRDGAGAVRVFPKAVLEEFGYYDEEHYGNFGEDYDMVLKTGEKYDVDRVHKVLYHYRRHADNTDVTRDPAMKYKNKNRARQEALRRRAEINKRLGK